MQRYTAYAKIDGKLAIWDVDAGSIIIAIHLINETLLVQSAVLISIK